MISFVVPGVPVAKGRPKLSTRAGFARAYTPKKTRDYESVVRHEAQRIMAGRSPLDGPLEVSITFFLPIPASWSRRRKQEALSGTHWPTGRPDIDNLGKAVLDGLNAVVFADDARIVDLHLAKTYAEQPHAFVEVNDWTNP